MEDHSNDQDGQESVPQNAVNLFVNNYLKKETGSQDLDCEKNPSHISRTSSESAWTPNGKRSIQGEISMKSSTKSDKLSIHSTTSPAPKSPGAWSNQQRSCEASPKNRESSPQSPKRSPIPSFNQDKTHSESLDHNEPFPDLTEAKKACSEPVNLYEILSPPLKLSSSNMSLNHRGSPVLFNKEKESPLVLTPGQMRSSKASNNQEESSQKPLESDGDAENQNREMHNESNDQEDNSEKKLSSSSDEESRLRSEYDSQMKLRSTTQEEHEEGVQKVNYSPNMIGEDDGSQGRPMMISEAPKVYDLRESGIPEALMLKEGNEIKPEECEEVATSGFEKFSTTNGIVIRQKFDILKGISGHQNHQRTYIHSYDENKAEKKMFQCNESCSFWSKQCLSNYCRPFDIVVSTCNSQESPDDHKPFLSLRRKCNFACLCFNRPEVEVHWIEDNRDEYLGCVKDSYKFCGFELNVYDKEDVLKYVIEGNSCQWGLMCNCNCTPCEEAYFIIKPVNGGRITQITKKNTQFSDVDFPGAERFVVNFSEEATPQDKSLLLGAVLFLESRYFEGDL